MPENAAHNEQNHRDHAAGPTGSFTCKINQRQHQQHARKNEKCHRRPHRRNRHKCRQKRPDNTPDRIKCPQRADRPPAVIEARDRVTRERRRARPEQETREHENQHTRQKCRNHQKMHIDRNDEEAGDGDDEVFAGDGDGCDPDRRDQEPPVEPVGVRVAVGGTAAVDISEGHGDHDGRDDDRPDDLRRGKIRREQAACAEFDSHDGHAGEEFGHVEIGFVGEDVIFHNNYLENEVLVVVLEIRACHFF